MNFKEGDDVQKGQVLFTLDRRPLEAALQTAEGNLERDTAQAANAATSAKRYQDLLARGIATKEQVDESATTAAALAATLVADRGAVANARVQLQYATIAAPIQGRTGQLRVHPGNLVRANDTTPLVTINQVSPISRRLRRPRRTARRAEALSRARGRCTSRRRRRARPIRDRRAGSRSSTTRSIRRPA